MLLSVFASASIADGIRAVALPLLAVELTQDPALIAGLGAAQSLPYLMAGLPAGVAADRMDRRRLLIVTNGIEAGLFAVLVGSVLLGVPSIPLLYTVALCLGTNETARDTTASTAVPALVGEDLLERANGRLVTAEFVGNQLFGPALGAGLFAVAIVSPFVAAMVLVTITAGLVTRLPSLNRASVISRRERAAAIAGGRALRRAAGSLYNDTREGVLFLSHHQVLRTVALLAVVLTLTDAAWFSVLVLLVTDELNLAGWAYGAILAIAALGGATGGLLAGRMVTRFGSAGCLRGGLLVIGAAQITLGTTSSSLGATLALAAGNAAFAVWLTAAASLRQALTPDRILGRVTAAWRTAALGAIPVGALLGGALAEAFGLRAPFIAGAPLVVGAALFARPLTAAGIAAARRPTDASSEGGS